jgi:hypothetical protein
MSSLYILFSSTIPFDWLSPYLHLMLYLKFPSGQGNKIKDGSVQTTTTPRISKTN